MDESPKIDPGIIDIFLLCSIFITIFVVGIFIIRAIRKQAVATRTGLKGQETNDLFTSFTKLEKILLFPILTLVWIFVKTYYKLFIRKSSEVANKKTKVIPKGKEEEKEGEEKEVDEGGEKREKEKLEQVANRN
jgi:Flp pilus assembly protein protease CpaA